MHQNPFKLEKIGIVLGREGLDEERYRILIMYSRLLEREIRPGVLLAAENYQSAGREMKYSVLQVESAVPIHFALGSNVDKLESEYPGFVISSAVSAAADWEQEEPREETTQIRISASPTGRMLVISSAHSQPYVEVKEDISSPKQGAYVHLLSEEAAEKVLNGELASQGRSIILATLLDPLGGVKLHIDPLELVKTHFGIFGFTKAGKSNVASVIAEKLFRASLTHTGLKDIRILIFDYMNEYFPLLADLFDDNTLKSGCSILNLDSEWGATLIQSGGKAPWLLLRNMTMPEDLRGLDAILSNILAEVVRDRRLRVNITTRINPADIASRLNNVLKRHRSKMSKKKSLALVMSILRTYPLFFWSLSHDIAEDQLIQICSMIAERLRAAIYGWGPLYALRVPETREAAATTLDDVVTIMAQQYRAADQIFNKQSTVEVASEEARSCIEELHDVLEESVNELRGIVGVPMGYRLDVNDMINIINDAKAYPGPKLFVIISENADRLRKFFATIGDTLYNERRKRGLSSPPVLFIVDEADEFVGTTYGEGATPPTIGESRRAAETIARRGRKLGIGIGIATQRVAYIDTKLMGQLHTYFVSKLPRKSDRERVAEAFGIPLSTIDRTLSLRAPRQWLVISHSSLGLPATPYFVAFENRAQQVRAVLQERARSGR
jgi:DNA helicase HerA-like ATPase